MSDLPIYWQSCIGCLNHKHVVHFLDHYVNVHRLDPCNARFVVHSDDASVQYRPEILKTLADRGFSSPRLWHGDQFSIHSKFDHLTSACADVPVNAWMLLVDVDELLDEDFDITDAVAEADNVGAVYIRARMIDHFGPGQSLPEIQIEPSLFEQFPETSNITSRIGHGNTVKVVLRKAWVELKNGGGHHTRSEGLPVYHEFPALHHFKWDALSISRLRQRAKDFASKGLGWWKESHRIANYLSGEDLDPPPFIETSADVKSEREERLKKEKAVLQTRVQDILLEMTVFATEAEKLLKDTRENKIARLMIRSSTIRLVSSHVKKSRKLLKICDFDQAVIQLEHALCAVCGSLEALDTSVARMLCDCTVHVRSLAKIKRKFEQRKERLSRPLEKLSRCTIT